MGLNGVNGNYGEDFVAKFRAKREELKNAYDDYEKTYIEGILDTIKKQAKK